MLRMNSKTDAQLLDERIAEIRRKNEERHKRYLEVEADKQNAAKENALVQLSPPADNWCVDRVEAYNDEPRRSDARNKLGDRSAGGSAKAAIEEDESRQWKSDEFYNEGKSQSFTRNKSGSSPPGNRGEQQQDKRSKPTRRPEIMLVKPPGRGRLTANISESGAVSYVFPEGEGPPPDPVYNFLADAERDPNRPDRRKRSPKRRDVPRGHPGAPRGRPPDMRPGYEGREVSRTDPQYEAWKAERDRIDQERINRQKTPDGQWRREWDKGKVPVEAMDSRPLPRNSRNGRRDVPSPGYQDPEPRTLQDFVQPVEVPKNRHEPAVRKHSHEKQRGTFGGDKGSMYGTPSSMILSPEGSPGSTPKHSKKERDVKSVGNSIVVSVPNESTVQQSPGLQRVKVNSRTAIGTGRVGPRQKVHLSYSSQSEDEIPHQAPQQGRVVKFIQPRTHPSPPSDKQQHDVMFTKPPRPPSFRHQELPKPRRSKELHARKKIGVKKYTDHGTDSKSGSDSAPEGLKSEMSVGDDVSREDEVVDAEEDDDDDDDDDLWEDVGTTSGTESMSAEDSTPVKKSLDTSLRSSESENCPDVQENTVINDESIAVVVDQSGLISIERTPPPVSLTKEVGEEFSEKGSYEPSEKLDASSEEKTVKEEEESNEEIPGDIVSEPQDRECKEETRPHSETDSSILPAEVEDKELNIVAENCSSEVNQVDSNILSEQNCKTELG